MFDNVKVPPVKSLGSNFDDKAKLWSLFTSAAISIILLDSTFFILGTTKPDEVSIAIPIL